MKYKVGDKVRVKSKEWWDAQPKDKYGSAVCGNECFPAEMTCMCGKVVTIDEVLQDIGCYQIKRSIYLWTDEMFEEISENDKSATLSEQLIKDIANVIKSHDLGVTICENEGKLIIEPLKVEKEENLPIDTPCMAKSDNNDEWRLRYYAGKCKCYTCGGKSNNEDTTSSWDCIIPCDNFNFQNPEESLKYNIVK